MKMHLLLLSCFCSCLSMLISPMMVKASEQDSPKKGMLQDLEVAKNHLQVKYAPKEWKQTFLGWNLKDAYDIAKARILNSNAISTKEYRKIFKQFLQSAEDYHVHGVFYSTAMAAFPLNVTGVDDHYYISGKNLEVTFINEESFFVFEDLEKVTQDFIDSFERIQIGDELIAINGISISEQIQNLITNQLGGDYSSTGHALAQSILFKHMGKYGAEVPSGNFTVTIIHKDANKPVTYTFPWFHAPEWVKDQDYSDLMKGQLTQFSYGGSNAEEKKKSSTLLAKALSKDFTVGIAKDLQIPAKKIMKNKNLFSKLTTDQEDEDDDEEDDDDREKGFLPPLGKVIWETPFLQEIYAYIYVNSVGQHVGYLSVPEFSKSGMLGNLTIDAIIQIFQRFNEENVVALVIDITSNPGGDLHYMYALLSLLTDRPLKLPTHQETLIPADVYNAAVVYKALENVPEDIEDNLSGYVINNDTIKKIREYEWSLIQAWESGKQLTEPNFLTGIDEIQPNSKMQFTKPLIVLTNELDFSCADFFPAILQDNKRATIFGKRTAGAGGYVRFYPCTSRFGVAGFTLTASIAYRVDGTPIENLGVTPDIPYEITARDIKETYVDYIQALDAAVQQVTAPKR